MYAFPILPTSKVENDKIIEIIKQAYVDEYKANKFK